MTDFAHSQSAAAAIDTLIHARWIIPVDGSQTILEHHTLAIANGRITAILPTDKANHLKAETVYNLPDHALMPGFINTHGHAAMSLLRGLADDLPIMTWLQDHIWPTETTFVNEDFVYDGTRLAIAEMIRCGTTTFSDNYFFPNAAGQAALEAGMSAQLVFPVMDLATAWAKDEAHYIYKGLEVVDLFRNQDSIIVGFGPHAPYSVSDKTLKEIITLSEQLDINIQMHIHESAHEVHDAVKATGVRPLRRLADLGLLSPRLQCTHMTQLNEGEIQLIAQNGCSVLHCPESNLKLASGFAPIARLQQAGINVAIGTDGCASNNDLDMLGEMRTASLIAKAVGQDATALGAWGALEASTINGARAMGIEAETGSLELGKKADIAAINLSELENQPMYNPVSQVVYTATRNQFTHVWNQGRILMADRQLTTLDETFLKQKARQWQDRIVANLTN
ncbi:TRZ/ATZ family hydrolase [Parendozoicomonas haliclonae]|uniref:5-methylthioadenosine/S-adenosylhomocysteine deaminase n=1 Tax=Parendozoicomonas haliclonae TaxID=1960125 RepID=A0A1X7AGX5_9GAMM|nr:TRZ/ATZ family hydrolase [Parendozoicomonas haliclonae]SMA41604.1 5-methylthioadenosine/S-adenosylhomocysteine deaminase [Parendozoicomonas haliclonae]